MSRFRRAIHSAASSYAVLIASAVYALMSLPLAMHYLSGDRFGLWGLMGSIAGYLSLIDLGMSGSISRLLIDHKDEPAGGTYGGLLKTGWLVLTTQAVAILVIGYFLAEPLSKMLNLEPALSGEFILLTRCQAGLLALTFLLRMFSQVLIAHQRMDIVNYSQMLGLALNLVFLWWFFRQGSGVFSLIWAGLLSSFGGAAMLWVVCSRLRLLPPAGSWGRSSWAYFREVFGYGKDLFMAAVGAQLIIASQSMIITARIGLVAAGAWTVGTRAFNLVSQGIWRASDVSAPAFSEMMVRGEKERLRERYRAVATLTASLSGFGAVAFALCNSLFVRAIGDWTQHPVEWPALNDVLLGLWMITNAIQRCHTMFIGQTKQIAFMRYIFFIEGTVFVLAALLVAKWAGLPGIISCSVICSVVFTGAYVTWRISHYFGLTLREVVIEWQAPMARMLALLAPAAMLLWWLTGPVKEPLLRLALHVIFCATLGFYLFLRFGLARSFQRELLERVPRSVNPLLKWVFVGAGQ